VKIFDLEARGTTVAREVRGGTATFLTMAYILFANPAILVAAGMPFGPVVAATAASSALASLLMALLYLGGEAVQIALQLPKALSQVFQGLLLMFLLGCDVLVNYRVARAPAAA